MTDDRKTYAHKEAFCLMWYECKSCHHAERYWNSRDGVTPFCTACPSCGRPELYHTRWGADLCIPTYRPHHGQRVWVDMTLEAATKGVDAYIVRLRAAGHAIDPDQRRRLIKNWMGEDHGGGAPNVAIAGYDFKVPT